MNIDGQMNVPKMVNNNTKTGRRYFCFFITKCNPYAPAIAFGNIANSKVLSGSKGILYKGFPEIIYKNEMIKKTE